MHRALVSEPEAYGRIARSFRPTDAVGADLVGEVLTGRLDVKAAALRRIMELGSGDVAFADPRRPCSRRPCSRRPSGPRTGA
ncbi:hypothetical protein [Streptomyces sp. NK08204]|uniref:hypothetical protein n=1 Tax=Streptomyces sp. NK08204 TaxID=2873260 RepID=UPI001CED0311|nr:hypothetical protein [Streptomyces sp. NK08204]